MIVARALVGFAFGFLLSASAVFVAAGWREGVACLACAATGAAVGLDVDRVTRKSRWAERDVQRGSQRVAEGYARVGALELGA